MAGKVRFGVIGTGSIAQHRHLPEIDANRYGEVVAVCDPVASRVKAVAEKYDAEPFADHKALLKGAEIDAVAVCTPNKFHAPISIDAMRAGKHVLVEKPMAISRAEAKRMIATAKKTRKHLMVGQNQRLMAAHIDAKQVLDSGKLGKVLTFYTSFQHSGPDTWSVDGAKSWFFDGDQAVMGTTGDLGVHKVDLMRWLLGQEIVEVGGVIGTLDKKRSGKFIDVDDNAQLVMKTSGGAIGTMVVSWTNYGKECNDTIVRCTNGMMHIGGDPEFGVIVQYADGNRELHSVGAMASNVKQVSSGVSDLFIECIRKNRKPEIDGMEGYRGVNVILTAMEAAKKRTFLKVKD